MLMVTAQVEEPLLTWLGFHLMHFTEERGPFHFAGLYLLVITAMEVKKRNGKIVLIYVQGFINTFLSWGAFAPLGRLSFIVYLIHYDFIGYFLTQLSHEVIISHLYVVSINQTS